MNNEDLEKKMEFIVEQQAHFAVQMGELQDVVGRLEDIVARLAQATVDRFAVTDKRVDEIDERFSALVNAQIQTEANVKKTDENLRNLIAVVDRYFSEGRNGRAEE